MKWSSPKVVIGSGAKYGVLQKTFTDACFYVRKEASATRLAEIHFHLNCVEATTIFYRPRVPDKFDGIQVSDLAEQPHLALPGPSKPPAIPLGEGIGYMRS